MNERTDLERALQEWRITAPLPPRFQERVWSRIERSESPGISISALLRGWFVHAFARPAFAVAYVSVLAVAGLALGVLQASHQKEQMQRQLEARYVGAVDPYQRSH